MVKHVAAPNDFVYQIEYPQAWHISDRKTQVVYYQDDPDEGTAFLVMAGGAKGELNANDVLRFIVSKLQQTYPDLQTRVQAARTEPMPGTQRMYIVDAEASWTGAQRQSMRALIRVRATYIPQNNPSDNSTLVVYLSGQAPGPVFDAWRPVYVRMIKSFFP